MQFDIEGRQERDRACFDAYMRDLHELIPFPALSEPDERHQPAGQRAVREGKVTSF